MSSNTFTLDMNQSNMTEDEFYGYPVNKDPQWTGVLYMLNNNLHLCLGYCDGQILSVQMGDTSIIRLNSPEELLQNAMGVVPNKIGQVRCGSGRTVNYRAFYIPRDVDTQSDQPDLSGKDLSGTDMSGTEFELGDLIINQNKCKLEYVVGWEGDLLWTITLGDSGAKFRHVRNIRMQDYLVWQKGNFDRQMPLFNSSRIGLPLEQSVLDKKPAWRKFLCF